MTMTEMTEIKNTSINTLVIGKDGGEEILAIGLKAAHQDKPQYQRALKHEYERNTAIDHDNIVKCKDMRSLSDWGECLVMEWQPARTLEEYIREHHSKAEEKQIIIQIAEALDFMHSKGQIHGALNTNNIFVTTNGDQVKLLNFRVIYADRMDEPSINLRCKAPEAKDGTIALDARTDIFSLGMILRRMNCAQDYENIANICCNFGRNDRYSDMQAFLDAFQHGHVTHKNTSANTTTIGHNRLIPIIALVVLAVVVGAAVLLFNNKDSLNLIVQHQSEQVENSNEQSSEASADGIEASAGKTSQANGNGTYQGELAFLNTLVPQMKLDLDKIYASGKSPTIIRKKVARYYKGLRKSLGERTESQYAAFDREFSEYIKSKNANMQTE